MPLYHWTDHELYQHFKSFGNIVSARIEREANGRNRGFGFVSYDTAEAATEAIKAMDGFQVAEHRGYQGHGRYRGYQGHGRLQVRKKGEKGGKAKGNGKGKAKANATTPVPQQQHQWGMPQQQPPQQQQPQSGQAPQQPPQQQAQGTRGQQQPQAAQGQQQNQQQPMRPPQQQAPQPGQTQGQDRTAQPAAAAPDAAPAYGHFNYGDHRMPQANSYMQQFDSQQAHHYGYGYAPNAYV